jgi:glucose-1-phosphate cytidylyltransferase
LEGDAVREFQEKPPLVHQWINGAFFVLEPQVLDLIAGDETPFEVGVLESLAREGELMAFRHTRFWQCMDTVHDYHLLTEWWAAGTAPWKVWT